MDETPDSLTSYEAVSSAAATLVILPSDDATSNDGEMAPTSVETATTTPSDPALDATPPSSPAANANFSNFVNPWTAVMGGIGSLTSSARGGIGSVAAEGYSSSNGKKGEIDCESSSSSNNNNKNIPTNNYSSTSVCIVYPKF